MVQRLAVIGFIVAVIIAIFAFTQQQQAITEATIARTAAARSDDALATAGAMWQDASGTQVGAEAALATAVRDMAAAGTAVAEAEDARDTAENAAGIAGTSEAVGLATAGAASTGVVETATAGMETASALYGEQADQLATAQFVVEEMATGQMDILTLLGTATAQVDLAVFAQESAEEDRATAVAQARAAETQVAGMRSDIATAQFVLTGLPPSTPAPTSPSSTPALDVTTVTSAETTPEAGGTTLSEAFTSTDGTITFQHPAGWLATQLENGLILIANSEATAMRSSAALTSGQFDINLFIVIGAEITGQPTPSSPADVLTSLATFLTEQSQETSFNAVRDITIGERAAARTDGSNGVNDALLLVMELGDDNFVVAFASSAPDELPDFEPTLHSIIETLEYTA